MNQMLVNVVFHTLYQILKAFSSLSFARICFTLELILLLFNSYIIFLLLSFQLNNSKSSGRRHSKLFTNCHVWWDALYS